MDPTFRFFKLATGDSANNKDGLRSKAFEYLCDWKSKPLDTWNQIELYWHEPWKTREEFERNLIHEKKGY